MVQGADSYHAPWLGWLNNGMFHHPAEAVGRYSSTPPAKGTPQIKVNSTKHSARLNAGKESVGTKYILLKSLTSWLFWCKFFYISTRVLEVLLCPVFSKDICLFKVASLGFADVASRDMSAEACRNQACRSSLPLPHWPTRFEFREGDIRIGQTKSAYISWNPGRIFEIQKGCLSEGSLL